MRLNPLTRRRLATWPLLLLTAASAPVFAQEPASETQSADPATIPVAAAEPAAAPAPATSAPQSVLLDEIIVTARKREELLQDVPISVAAFNAAQLEAKGIANISDLGQAISGLQFSDLAGYNLIYIRGIGTDAFIPSADPSVATYLDGIYFPSGHSAAQSFGALERIEVLKGPQGTLFGRNSTGGAISIVTERPSQEAKTSVQLSYSRFDDIETRVHTNVPLTDAVAVSVSAFYDHADNYYRLDNPSGDALPAEISKGARVKLGIELSDDLDLVLTGLRLRRSGTSTTTSANTDPSPLLGALIPKEERDYVVAANSAPSLTLDAKAYYGELRWQQPWFDTKLLGSYYYINAYDYVYDFDGSALPIATYGADSEFQRIVTSELQFTSNDTSWGADWLKWVGGFYYLNSKGGYDPGYLRLLDVARLPIQPIIDALPPALGNAVRDRLGGVIAPSDLTFYFTGLLGTKSYSTYAQTTASLTDWLDLTLGGRYQRETRELLVSNVGLGNIGGGISTVIPFAPRESTVNNFSPKVSLDVRPIKDVLLYASYQQGFKSATYNIINIYQQPDYVKPERVSSYELGLKSDWFDRKLRFNAAAFQSEIDNLQTGFVSFTSGGAINFENAGKARIRGVEFDTLVAPLPTLAPGLVFTASGSWLDAVYTEYENGSGYDEFTGLAFSRDNGTGRDFAGNRIVRTPKFSGTVGAVQSIEIGDGTLEVAGDYYYNDGYYYLAQNSENSFEDAYGVVSARISYLYHPWSLKLTVFGENLGDARYNVAQFHTDFGREDTLAPPSVYGVRINWDF